MISERGKAIYEECIKHLVDPLHYGKFVVIDVETGDYEIDNRDIVATKRLLERRPGAMTYGVRVGFLAAYRMGGRNWISGNDDWEG
jgi:hypothetical protein